jgi:hypothetical protein
MKKTLTGTLFFFVWQLFAVRAYAQFGSGVVFDPTQSGHAIEQIRQAEQLFTTAAQTRDQVIATYNLARQMAKRRRVGLGLSGCALLLQRPRTMGNARPQRDSTAPPPEPTKAE